MPAEPLIDFAALDLTRTVAGRDELRSVLRQRGTFELIDGVLHLDVEGELVVGYKDVRADDWWAADHIPGRPLFPGCLMVEGAAQVTSFHFLRKRRDLEGAFIGFSAIDGTRFRAPVEPPCRLVTAGRLQRMRRNLFTYRAQAFVERRMVFEATISGMVIEGA